ncbi:NUDIX hydrolase [Metallibacterium sp.]|uniref:NUDIX hydrolase n=1 Tax=Metallibacterium sp. TaxID=2940281 RepID=UPI0026131AD7|nr:NUDIX hydrolase [Metallibacterium sp.]
MQQPTPPASDTTPDQQQLLASLMAYRADDAEQRTAQTLFTGFARSHPDCCQRTHPPGHFTGSAWLVSKDGARVLLTHHRKLDRWLQLGGHADGDADLARVALREAEEESGLAGLRVEGGIFDLDCHAIPARGSDPAHLHWDVRYVVRAGVDERYAVSAESLDLAWRPIAEIAADTEADPSLRRMAVKWLQVR